MVPVCSSVMLELVLTVHSYHVIAYPVDNENLDTFTDRCTSLTTISFEMHLCMENVSK